VLFPTNIWQILRAHGRGKPRPYNASRARTFGNFVWETTLDAPDWNSAGGGNFELVLNPRPEDGEDHQIGESEKELLGVNSRSLCGAGEKAEVTAECDLVEFIQVDVQKPGDFLLGEHLLAGLNANHPVLLGLTAFADRHAIQYPPFLLPALSLD
jgi:hypothetical protein